MEVTSSTSVGAAASNAYAQLDSAEFVNILIEELQNQDPLAPSDSSAILEQLSSLRNIESQTMLAEQLEELVKQNQVASAGNLIGKMVEGIDTNNTRTDGLVNSVRVSDAGIFLELDNGRSMHIDQVTGIFEHKDADQATPTPADNTTPPDNTPTDPVTTFSQDLLKGLQNIINPDTTTSADPALIANPRFLPDSAIDTTVAAP